MGESIPASLKLFIPEGGFARWLLADDVQRALDLGPNSGIEEVLQHGGTIYIDDPDAPWGWPAGIDLDDPEESTLDVPDGIDYDYHQDPKYEYNSFWRFQRSGRCLERPSNQDRDILLREATLKEALQQGLQDEALVALFRRPEVSYPVPDRQFVLDLG